MIAAILLCGCGSRVEDPQPFKAPANPLERLRIRLYASDQNNQLAQSQAARQLGRSAAGVEILKTATTQRDEEVRSMAALGLASSSEPMALKLVPDLLKDSSESVRVAALGALYGRRTPEIQAAVENCLKAKEPMVRCSAIGTLSGFGGAETLKAISQLSNDPSLDVRRTYYRVLPRYGNQAIPLLQKGAKDPTQEIAGLAKSVLDGMLVAKPKKPNPRYKL